MTFRTSAYSHTFWLADAEVSILMAPLWHVQIHALDWQGLRLPIRSGDQHRPVFTVPTSPADVHRHRRPLAI